MIKIRCSVMVTLAALLAAQAANGAGPVLQLSFKQAVEMALSQAGNAQIPLAMEAQRIAEARYYGARAALLPSFEGSITGQNQTRNLAAMGLQISVPLPYTFPTVVGPFNTFDARIGVTQSVLDFTSLRRVDAFRAGIQEAKTESAAVAEEVAVQVASRYVAGQRAAAGIDAAQANIDLAVALLKLAQDRESTGKGIAIDVTRARAQLVSDRQHLLAAELGRIRAFLELLRALGLPLDTDLQLTDPLTFSAEPPVGLERALALAIESRSELKIVRQHSEIARRNDEAIRAERLPSIISYADFGALGLGFRDTAATHTVGVSLRIPVFDAGRRESKRAETLAVLRQDEIRRRDLMQKVELQVREALALLHAAEQQVKVAEESLSIATEELEQARRRLVAGVTSNLEVIEAQARLARGRDNRAEAVAAYNQARIDLSAATGTIRSLVP
jgi:outer membrane protein